MQQARIPPKGEDFIPEYHHPKPPMKTWQVIAAILVVLAAVGIYKIIDIPYMIRDRLLGR